MNPAIMNLLTFASLFRVLYLGMYAGVREAMDHKNNPHKVPVGGKEWARLIKAKGYNTLRI